MLNIGILGAARIAPAAIIRPAKRRSDVRVVAVASRSESAARLYADANGIDEAFGDYGQLLEHADIDLVYNALPPSQHAEWSIAALRAGKHVLCEKPYAMNAIQAERMRRAALETGGRLIEAFHDRYHPLSHEVDRLIRGGIVGDVVSLEAEFSAPSRFDPTSLRHDPALGGGALMDRGCYPVHWIRALMTEEPSVTSASTLLNPLGADLATEASLVFPSGVTARILAGMMNGSRSANFLRITGTRGEVLVDNLLFPTRGHSITVDIGGLTRLSTVGGMETYDHQLAAIVEGLESGEEMPTEGLDSVNNMKVIDAIYESAGVLRDFG